MGLIDSATRMLVLSPDYSHPLPPASTGPGIPEFRNSGLPLRRNFVTGISSSEGVHNKWQGPTKYSNCLPPPRHLRVDFAGNSMEKWKNGSKNPPAALPDYFQISSNQKNSIQFGNRVRNEAARGGKRHQEAGRETNAICRAGPTPRGSIQPKSTRPILAKSWLNPG